MNKILKKMQPERLRKFLSVRAGSNQMSLKPVWNLEVILTRRELLGQGGFSMSGSSSQTSAGDVTRTDLRTRN